MKATSAATVISQNKEATGEKCRSWDRERTDARTAAGKEEKRMERPMRGQKKMGCRDSCRDRTRTDVETDEGTESGQRQEQIRGKDCCGDEYRNRWRDRCGDGERTDEVTDAGTVRDAGAETGQEIQMR